jgi:Domain of unknown function (DUF4129)
MNRATGRVVALIALLLLVGIALRGYLPGEKHAATDAPSNNPAATIAVVTLLAAAIAIITIAVIATLRQPRRPRQGGQPLRDSPFGVRTRPSWRFLLIAVGLILVWLVFLVLLLQTTVVIDLGHPSATTTPTTPAPSTTPAPPATPRTPQGERGDVLRYLLATTIFMIAVWGAGFVIALRRRGREPQPQPFVDGAPAVQASAPHSLAVAAERGLAEMGDLSREPREAIIACYAAMEDALSNAPEAMPRDSDTPSEVLARAVDHHAIHTGTATELVDLFTEARFSPHVMTEEHREIAVRALQNVLAELKSAV